eukprot:s233_g21.t1
MPISPDRPLALEEGTLSPKGEDPVAALFQESPASSLAIWSTTCLPGFGFGLGEEQFKLIAYGEASDLHRSTVCILKAGEEFRIRYARKDIRRAYTKHPTNLKPHP